MRRFGKLHLFFGIIFFIPVSCSFPSTPISNEINIEITPSIQPVTPIPPTNKPANDAEITPTLTPALIQETYLPVIEPSITQLPSTITFSSGLYYYSSPEGGVTIKMQPEARYIVVGDSMAFGAVFEGKDTYEYICFNRWPFSEQVSKETGIMTTASLDRGQSMFNPFLTTRVHLRMRELCESLPGEKETSTSVPASNSREWLDTHLYNQVIQEDLRNPENKIVLFILGADAFAEKVGKEPVGVDGYEQNVGRILEYLVGMEKIIYIAAYPHVISATFVNADELESYNGFIDQMNERLLRMISNNGYFNIEANEWVSFGEQEIIQDYRSYYVTTLQPGPRLDILSDTELQPHYRLDGLHYDAEGYDLIGSEWAKMLKQPARVTLKE